MGSLQNWTKTSLPSTILQFPKNRNIYPEAVTSDGMRLIGPKCDQLGLINHCLLEESRWYLQWLMGPNWSHLGQIRRIPSHVTASGYIFRLSFRSQSDVLILWRVSDEKSFQYVKRMLPLFRTMGKFYSTNSLFNSLSPRWFINDVTTKPQL